MATDNNDPASKLYNSFTEDTDKVFDVQKAKWEYAKERASLQLDNERWKNRRRMAWLALWSIIIATTAMFTVVPESRIEALDEIVAWFMMGMVSIVGTYIGTSTWANVVQARANRPSKNIMSDNPWNNYGGGRLDDPEAQKSDYYSEK